MRIWLYQGQMQRMRVMFLMAGMLLAAGLAAQAGDLKLEATLVWGTTTGTNVTHQLLDEKRSKDLARIFKWQHYYEITNRTATIPANQTNIVPMGAKCQLKVKNLGASRVEVVWTGSGKVVNTSVSTLPTVLAGPDKNDSAYFMILRSTDGKGK